MSLNRSILIFFLSFLCACSSIDEELDKILFQVDILDTEWHSVDVQITHNATNRHVYYTFVVKGAVVDVEQEIMSFLESGSDVLADCAHTQRKSVFKIGGLSPSTTYTLINFGMNEGGKIYGNFTTCVFETDDFDFALNVNPDWNVTYNGHTVYKDIDRSVIQVDVLDAPEERFFISVCTRKAYETFTDLYDYIIQTTDEFVSDKKNQTNSDYWFEDEYLRSEGTIYYTSLSEGDYIAFAIGINTDGTPTGNYATSGIFHVDKYPLAEGFSNLFGRWRISDSQGTEFDIDISEKQGNKSVNITGWAGKSYTIVATFQRSSNSFIIKTQLVESDMTVEFNDGTIAEGQLNLRGFYYNSNSQLIYIKNINDLGEIVPNGDGSYAINALFYPNNNPGLTYSLVCEDVTYNYRKIVFPMMMTKVD